LTLASRGGGPVRGQPGQDRRGSRGGHAGAGGSFSILRFEERDLPDVVYIEPLTSAVYLDQRTDVEHYLEIVDQLSGEALTPADTMMRHEALRYTPTGGRVMPPL
jgi:hypothetical protein